MYKAISSTFLPSTQLYGGGGGGQSLLSPKYSDILTSLVVSVSLCFHRKLHFVNIFLRHDTTSKIYIHRSVLELTVSSRLSSSLCSWPMGRIFRRIPALHIYLHWLIKYSSKQLLVPFCRPAHKFWVCILLATITCPWGDNSESAQLRSPVGSACFSFIHFVTIDRFA